ncbi:MAG TPA: AAA family ATPase, partial [Candidatus Elarobacter sp.]
MEAHPRVIRLIARPGWGKTTFARQLAAESGVFVAVDCRDATSATVLAERLAEAFERKPACVIVDFAERLADVPNAFATLQRVLEEQIASCRFVVASRIELPVGAGRAISPADVLTVRAGDLAFDAAEVREVFAGLSVTEEMLERVVALSLGWPIAIYLFARLAREQRLPAALADLSHPSLDDMFEYGERETFPALTPAQRTGIAAAVAIPDAALEEIDAAVGEAPRQALQDIAARTGLPVTPDGRFMVPEITAEAVRRTLREEFVRARDAAVHNAVAAGAHVRAAEIRFADRDYDGAVTHLEALGSAGAGATVSTSYRALVKQLPPTAILRSRNVLVAVLADRETQANPYPLWQAVEEVRSARQRENDPELAAGIRAAHAALLRMIERPRDARIELEDALAVRDPSPARTALLTANLAAVVAIHGDLATAEVLLERAGVPREGATNFPMERIEVELARDRLHGDPASRRLAHARYVDEARLVGPAAHGQALRLFAANAWLDGDDAAAVAAIDTRNRLVGALPWERRLIGVSLPPLDVRPARLDRWTCLWYT